MNMNKYFIDQIKNSIKNSTGLVDPKVQIPKDQGFGHFTTTAVLQLKGVDQDVHNIGLKITEAIGTLDFIGKIDITKNGFINMWIDNNYFICNWEVLWKEILSNNITLENNPDVIDDLSLYNINYCYSRIKSILRVLSYTGIYPKPRAIDEKIIATKDLELLQSLWNINFKTREGLRSKYEDILNLIQIVYGYLPFINHRNNDINIGFRLSMLEATAHIIKLWAASANIEIKERM
jgi:arginyl-tRNA synthetase